MIFWIVGEGALAADWITASKSFQGGYARSQLDHDFQKLFYYIIMGSNLNFVDGFWPFSGQP